eukprot:COSAG06_NODE_1877_length_8156_cov_8.117538_2_plen_81_part_00
MRRSLSCRHGSQGLQGDEIRLVRLGILLCPWQCWRSTVPSCTLDRTSTHTWSGPSTKRMFANRKDVADVAPTLELVNGFL